MPIKKPARKPFGVKSEPKPSKTQIRNKMNKKTTKKTTDKETLHGYPRRKMKSGGKVLKPVPAEKKGLSKLPTKVRNKMGFMKKGGRVGLKSGGLAKRGKGCEIK